MQRRNAVQKLGEKGPGAPTGLVISPLLALISRWGKLSADSPSLPLSKSADLGDFRITKTDRSSAEEGYTTFTKIDHEAEEKKKEEDRKELEEEAKKQDAKPTAVILDMPIVSFELFADVSMVHRARRSAKRTPGGRGVSRDLTELARLQRSALRVLHEENFVDRKYRSDTPNAQRRDPASLMLLDMGAWR